MGAQLRSAKKKARSNHVLYFYGVSQRRPDRELQQMGVDLRSPVEVIKCDRILCWVSRVSAAEFGTDLAKNMENLDWLTTASVAHQRAIESVSREVDMLPARFGTIFRDEQSLNRHIASRTAAINADFKKVRDADEWGVKVFEVAQSRPISATPSTGKDYLLAKAASLRRVRSSRDSEYVTEFKNALEQVAEESAATGNVSGGQRDLTFQSSFLIKRKNQKRFEDLLKKFSQRWDGAHRIECSGPWPPYSFVSREANLE